MFIFIIIFIPFIYLFILVVLSLSYGTLWWGMGFSSCSEQAPEYEGSVVMARGLSLSAAYGFPVPSSGMEPMSPALECGFLTTGPPGKFLLFIITSNKCSMRKMRICQEGKK